ncbi:hypothetical protein EDB89DRAFT_766293 [Lactarius sanguifluus]|nr:hypothetical protein EDB89DRAFT_766293 [Lactarius sanguifluus]
MQGVSVVAHLTKKQWVWTKTNLRMHKEPVRCCLRIFDGSGGKHLLPPDQREALPAFIQTVFAQFEAIWSAARSFRVSSCQDNPPLGGSLVLPGWRSLPRCGLPCYRYGVALGQQVLSLYSESSVRDFFITPRERDLVPCTALRVSIRPSWVQARACSGFCGHRRGISHLHTRRTAGTTRAQTGHLRLFALQLGAACIIRGDTGWVSGTGVKSRS